MKKYNEYILSIGKGLNQEIKNNIYINNDSLLKVMLVDYVNDTYEYYDARNCPDYVEDYTPISPEDMYVTTLITEKGNFALSDETGNFQLITEDSIFIEVSNRLMSFITEDGEKYFQTEGDYERFMFDRNTIKECLTILARDIECKI